MLRFEEYAHNRMTAVWAWRIYKATHPYNACLSEYHYRRNLEVIEKIYKTQEKTWQK